MWKRLIAGIVVSDPAGVVGNWCASVVCVFCCVCSGLCDELRPCSKEYVVCVCVCAVIARDLVTTNEAVKLDLRCRPQKIKSAYILNNNTFHPITCHEGTEGSRDMALPSFNLCASWGWVVNTTPRLLYPGKWPSTQCLKAGWAPGLLWTRAENLASTGIRTPFRPACSKSLYRLSSPSLWWDS